MTISKTMEDAINGQINREMYSAYLYVSMATHFEEQSLDGFAKWMHCQAEEEMVHAMKFYRYLNERGGRVRMLAIEEPAHHWETPLALFEAVYEHEQHVTSLINGLMTRAIDEKDYASQQMLQWFIEEQVEEEDSASSIVDKIKLMADAPGGLYMLDKELGTRVFTPPAEGEE